MTPDISVVFRSRTQMLILAATYRDVARKFVVTELAREIGIPQPTVAREVDRLDVAGLVFTEKKEGLRLVCAATTNPIFGELQSILRFAA